MCAAAPDPGFQYRAGDGGLGGVAGQTNVTGADAGQMTLEDTNNTPPAAAYRVWVRLP